MSPGSLEYRQLQMAKRDDGGDQWKHRWKEFHDWKNNKKQVMTPSRLNSEGIQQRKNACWLSNAF
jgi:hypothetical protein